MQSCEKYSESLSDYKHLLVWNINAPLHQAVLNFLGRTKDPSVLVGEHINIEECELEWKRTGNKMALFQSQLFGMIVAYYFHNHKLAEHHIKQFRPGLYDDGPDILVPLRYFYTCLVYLSRFHASRKRVYKQKIRAILQQFRKWVDEGAVNCYHMDLLMKAELLSVSSATRDAIEQAYNKAIESAADSGMRQHHALANELAGSYSYRLTDLSRARLHLTKARDLYREWEATAKVKELENRFSELFSS